MVPPTIPHSIATASDRITSVDLSNQATYLVSDSFRELTAAQSPPSRVTAFPLHLRDDPVTNVFSEPSASTSQPRRLKQKTREGQRGGQISADVVLANCARQKTRLREDIDTLYTVFWVGARDAWARALSDQPCRDEARATTLTDMVAAGGGKGDGADRRVRP
jgi:hypothetical protein